jgi:hypothetical protein
MKMMQKDWLIRHLVLELRLALNKVKPLSQNLAILSNTQLRKYIWKGAESHLKWLPAPFTYRRRERDL